MKKNRIMLSIGKLFLLVFLITSCNSSEAQNFERIGNDKLVKLLKDPEVQLVDVRTEGEVENGIIEGAIHMNYYDDFEQKASTLDKDKPVVVYCAVGGRSAGAAKKLSKMGFTKIYDLKPGIKGWVSDGYKIVSPN